MRKLYIIMILSFVSMSIMAQSPEKISYQAVIRDADNNLVTNTSVGIQVSILKGSASGTSVYTETQTPTTNANGLVSIEIGTGTTSDDFTTIDWADGPYFIKTETDPAGGNNYTITSTNQLLSVPYALHAKTVEIDNVDDADADPTNELQVLSISNDTIFLTEGGFVKLPDASVPQQFSVSEFGDTLSLSNGNHIIIPGLSNTNYEYKKYGVMYDQYFWGSVVCINDEIIFVKSQPMQTEFLCSKIDTMGQEKWNKTFSIDTINSINGNSTTLTNDGGYISLFSVESVNNNQLSILIKSDSNGDTTWTRAVDCPIGSIFQTTDNKYLVGTSKRADPDSDIDYSGYSMLAKLNETGDTLWTKFYEYSESAQSVHSIYNTSDGDYLFGGGNNKLYKTSSEGITEWIWEYEGEGISSILETSDNNYLVVYRNIDTVHIAKLDSDKNLIWSKKYGGTDWDYIKYSFNLSNNNILLIGITQSNDGDLPGNHGESDIWLLQINASGDIIKSKVYGGTGSDYLDYSAILSNNRLLIIAKSNSNDGNVPNTNDNGGTIFWIFTLNVN